MPKENDKLNYMEPSKAVLLSACERDGLMPKPHVFHSVILKQGNSLKGVKDFRKGEALTRKLTLER